MKANSRKLFSLVVILLISLSIAYVVKTEAIQEAEVPYKQVISSINYDRINEHVEKICSFGNRFPGASGCERTAEYILNKFKEYGLEATLEEYEETTIVPYEAKIIFDGEEIRCYSLLPNGVETCTTPAEGIEGHLVYIENLKKINVTKYNLDGSIVLTEFNVGKEWVKLVDLGVKGVIFIDPGNYTLIECNRKYLAMLPLDFPRLVISRENVKKLMEAIAEKGEVKIRIINKMEYENRKLVNVVGKIKGTEGYQTVIFVTHFDSWSVIPENAPGASSAVKVGVLLELAKYLSENKPVNNVIFLACSGHGLGLSGVRHYIDRHFNELRDVPVVIGIEICGYGKEAAMYDTGNFYAFEVTRKSQRDRWLKNMVRLMLEDMSEKLGEKYELIESEYSLAEHPPSEGRYFISEMEAFLAYGGIASAIVDAGGEREFIETPSDTIDKVSVERSKKAVEILFALAYKLVNSTLPNEVIGPERASGDYGFMRVRGNVTVYNISRDEYEPLPNAIVMIGEIGTGTTLGPAPLFSLIKKTDENGYFEVVGLVPSRGGMVYGFAPFLDEPSEGPVDYAPDWGMYSFPGMYSIRDDGYHVMLTAFKCGSIFLYNVLDPAARQMMLGTIQIIVLRHETQDPSVEAFSTMMDMKAYTRGGGTEVEQWRMVFLEEGKRYDLLIVNVYPSMYIIGILNNATEDKPMGYGYTVKSGETLYLKYELLKILSDIGNITASRYKLCEENEIYAETAKTYLKLAEIYYNRSIENLKAGDYEAYQYDAKASWVFQYRAYKELTGLIYSTTSSTYVFFAILLPFAFIMERLLFEYEDMKKRFGTVFAIFVIFSVLTYFLHPGFKLLPNVFMAAVLFAMVVFGVIAISLLGSEFYKMISELKVKTLGLHASEVSRSGAIPAALSMGIRNLRKRKLRSALTLISVIVVTATLISSISVVTTLLPTGMKGIKMATPYNGILVRDVNWNPLEERLYDILRTTYPEAFEKCVYRVWYYGGTTMKAKVVREFPEEFSIVTIVGMMPEERDLTKIDTTIVEGRWLEPGDLRGCIISNRIARNLRIKIGEKILVAGREFEVVGVFDNDKFVELRDIDGYPLLPILTSITGRTQSITTDFVQPENLIIVNAEVAKELGGGVTSIALKARSNITKDELMDIGKKLTFRFNRNLYVAYEGEIVPFSIVPEQRTRGLPMLLVLMSLLVVSILNTMITAVKEREREIFIYSSVGLSPTHVSGLFLAEALTIGIIGAVLGYVAGMGFHVIFNILGVLTELHPNLTSIWIPGSLLIVVLFTALSTLYPMRKAAFLVTPSIERRWKLPPPKGDKWYIPLPFTSSRLEVDGVIAYLKEYFDVHRSEREGDFAVDKMEVKEYKEDGKQIKCIEAIIRHKPWDLGIMNFVRVSSIIEEGKETCTFEVYIERRGGFTEPWKKAVKIFVDHIRKQLLMWRSLKPEEKARYTGIRVEITRE